MILYLKTAKSPTKKTLRVGEYSQQNSRTQMKIHLSISFPYSNKEHAEKKKEANNPIVNSLKKYNI
jgi:hypothetical protein